MAQDITLLGASYHAVPAVTLPKTGGGTATFYDDVGTKTVTITENGTITEDVTGYASAEISVSVPTGPAKTSDDLTVSGPTVTAPAGLYSSAASKSVASGTAGTPTATKGTVSNHTVAVTPSVINTTGYITGGTLTGTAVSVSAAELVSGSETKTANGTYDVTNLAELVVNVSGGGGGTSGISTFDFTQGVTDQETGLYRFVLANATQDSTGLHIGASNAIASLSNLSLYDHVVEFKTGTLSKSYSTGHGRLYMSDGSNGIIYRNTNVWSVYGGSWTDSSQTSISYLQNAIIRIEYPSSGDKVSIYVNDTLLFNNVAFGPAISTSIMLGATGNAFYNATFEWLKIYTNEAYALKTLLGG